jgi:myo-inositol-1(or 4)-monophosphatase
LEELLETAREAAGAAAAVHRARAGTVDTGDADEKGRADFVSEVDLEAQRAALAIIRSRHPDHRILAEEEDPALLTEDRPALLSPSEAASGIGRGGPIWVVDPLDGTANFLNGHPLHCASVGLVLDGRPVVGAVACAPLNQEWWAARGLGAYRNGTRIRASTAPDLALTLIGTGFPFKAIHRLDEYLAGLGAVLRDTAGVRRGGSAALDLCHVAEGTLTAFWELSLSPWDWVGGLAILAEAGGVSGRLEGGAIDPLVGGSVVAAGTEAQLRDLRALVASGTPSGGSAPESR